jgi:hypothetical protein
MCATLLPLTPSDSLCVLSPLQLIYLVDLALPQLAAPRDAHSLPRVARVRRVVHAHHRPAHNIGARPRHCNVECAHTRVPLTADVRRHHDALPPR